MNRGSGRDRCLPAGSPEGFNEAPIHESGKYARAGTGGSLGGSFNEAPIHESGK